MIFSKPAKIHFFVRFATNTILAAPSRGQKRGRAPGKGRGRNAFLIILRKCKGTVVKTGPLHSGVNYSFSFTQRMLYAEPFAGLSSITVSQE